MAENWKKINDLEYEVSDLGRIRSLKCGRIKILKTYLNNGRNFIRLYENSEKKYHNFYVNRLVANAFLNNPLGLSQVNHINGDKTNDCIMNLEWISRSGNIKHALENKLINHKKGEEHGRSILSSEDVLSIRNKRLNGSKYTELAKEYKVSIGCIQGALKNNWKHL